MTRKTSYLSLHGRLNLAVSHFQDRKGCGWKWSLDPSCSPWPILFSHWTRSDFLPYFESLIARQVQSQCSYLYRSEVFFQRWDFDAAVAPEDSTRQTHWQVSVLRMKSVDFSVFQFKGYSAFDWGERDSCTELACGIEATTRRCEFTGPFRYNQAHVSHWRSLSCNNSSCPRKTSN